MLAISADTMVLPRPPPGLEGEGFPVRRAFAGVDLAALEPFVHTGGLLPPS